MLTPDTTNNERIDMLEKSTWAEGFSNYELQIFATYLKVYRINPGEVILKEGKADSLLCLVVDGKVEVTKLNEKNLRPVLATITRGKSFGEMSILDGEPHSADVSAITDTTLLVLTKDKLNQVILEKPAIGAKLLFKLGKLLSQRLRMTDGKLVDHL